MPTPLDVQGTMTRKIALIIGVVVVVGLFLAFTPLRVVGYVLLALGAALYFFETVRSLIQHLKQRRT